MDVSLASSNNWSMGESTMLLKKKGGKLLLSALIAGAGFEPATFGL
jgi:hypothetical protein